MEISTVWWIAAGIALILELISGTFYLLMFALGLASGAIAAHAGTSTTFQIITASFIGAGSVALWHFLKNNSSDKTHTNNTDIHLDIGEVVHVDLWNQDGTAYVNYRGSRWTAMQRPNSTAMPGTGNFRIVGVDANRLVIEKQHDD